MALMIAAVLVVPLAIFSSEHFGRPLFNYTRYWMWMDDFMTEAWPFQDKYPGRVQLEQLSDDEAPSISWYFKRHGVGDAAQRLQLTPDVVDHGGLPSCAFDLGMELHEHLLVALGIERAAETVETI